jgi:hypothetical protein
MIEPFWGLEVQLYLPNLVDDYRINKQTTFGGRQL